MLHRHDLATQRRLTQRKARQLTPPSSLMLDQAASQGPAPPLPMPAMMSPMGGGAQGMLAPDAPPGTVEHIADPVPEGVGQPGGRFGVGLSPDALAEFIARIRALRTQYGAQAGVTPGAGFRAALPEDLRTQFISDVQGVKGDIRPGWSPGTLTPEAPRFGGEELGPIGRDRSHGPRRPSAIHPLMALVQLMRGRGGQ